jgi:Mg-chelatase subunit ChlD
MISPVPSVERSSTTRYSASGYASPSRDRSAASIVAASLHAGITTDTRGQRTGTGGSSRASSGTPRRNNSAAIAVRPQYTAAAIARTNRMESTMRIAVSRGVPRAKSVHQMPGRDKGRHRRAAVTISPCEPRQPDSAVDNARRSSQKTLTVASPRRVRERIATNLAPSTATPRGTRLDDVEAMRTIALFLLVLNNCVGQLGVAMPRTVARVAANTSVTVDVHFYGVPLRGAQDLVFVVDKSGSMDGAKLATAKRELVDVVDRLPDGTRIGIVFFDNTFWTWPSGIDRKLETLTRSNRRYAHNFIDMIDANNSTAAVPALKEAAAIGARHIVLLSDGLANEGGNADDLVALATEYGRRGIRIDTVGVGDDTDDAVMTRIAEVTGGVAKLHR